MAKPKYPKASEHKRVSKNTQDELDSTIGSGKFQFALVVQTDGSIDTFANKDTMGVMGPTDLRDNPDTGQWEESDGASGWKAFDVKQVLLSQSIQILTVLRNPICKVIVYPDGTKVHYHIP